MSKNLPEDVLIDLLRSGEKSGLTYLYDHYSGALYGVILRIVQSEDIADEVLQDVFLKIWNRIASYDSSKGKLFTWMINIARNQAIDRMRSKESSQGKKTTRMDKVVSRVENSDFIEQSIDGIGVRDLLKNLSAEQKFIVEHLYLKGYTQSEVAEEFGIPLGTVKTRLRLAMQELRSLLGVK